MPVRLLLQLDAALMAKGGEPLKAGSKVLLRSGSVVRCGMDGRRTLLCGAAEGSGLAVGGWEFTREGRGTVQEHGSNPCDVVGGGGGALNG